MVSHCARPTLTFSQFISQPSTGVRSFRLRPSSEALLRARAPGAKKAPHTRTPHLLRPRVARAQETIRLHPLLCSEPLLKGAVEVALNCAHRATTVLSWGLCEHEGHLAALPHPSKLARFLLGGGLVDPRMRASNEALPRARVPRAGGPPGRPLSSLLTRSSRKRILLADPARDARFSEPSVRVGSRRGFRITRGLHRDGCLAPASCSTVAPESCLGSAPFDACSASDYGQNAHRRRIAQDRRNPRPPAPFS